MAEAGDLTVRQFERTEVMLDAEFVVAVAQEEQIRFEPSARSVRDARTIRLTVADVGLGGLGLHSPVFLPRMAAGMVRIFLPGESGDGEATDADRAALEQPVRVRRCEMLSRGPSYFVGVSFEAPGAELEATLQAFMERAARAMHRTALARLRAAEGRDA